MDGLYFPLYGVLISLNICLLVSGIDDAFIDFYYWGRECVRRLTIWRRHARFDLRKIHEKEARPFAILVPAWKEFSVIAQMIEGVNADLDYQKFQVFVGTYINDPETQSEVDRMVRRFQNVQRVDVPHPGPTCKADCLNYLVQAILDFEKKAGEPFAGLIVHDAEDVIHPLELKVFNYLIDRMDLIQLPVLSLPRRYTQWVAGTYQDDFVESHSKDLVVRESLTRLVPCAGTGMCYSRKAMGALIEETGEMPFNTSTLTEDYDFSFRLKRVGMKQAFVQIHTLSVNTEGGRAPQGRGDLLGVREYFPSSFRAAYRQRARWILGISFQGWESMGWKGGGWTKYFMWRDRKGLITCLLTLPIYLVFILMLAIEVANRFGAPVELPDYFYRPQGMLVILSSINAVLMINRLVQRFVFVKRYYGWVHAVLSPFRVVVNNFINFMAASRAWKLYLIHRLTGKPLAWDKTAHIIPENAVKIQQKLGEVLLEWGVLRPDQLEKSLQLQESSGMSLGQILIHEFAIDEATIADAIAAQSHLPRSKVSMFSLAKNQALLDREIALKYGWIPLGIGEHDELLLGSCMQPSKTSMKALDDLLDHAPKFFIITESEMIQGLNFLTSGKQELGREDALGLFNTHMDPKAMAPVLAYIARAL